MIDRYAYTGDSRRDRRKPQQTRFTQSAPAPIPHVKPEDREASKARLYQLALECEEGWRRQRERHNMLTKGAGA
jgi:hypothetical protein